MGRIADWALSICLAAGLLLLALRRRRMTIRDLLTEQEAERASGLVDGEVVTIPDGLRRG